MNGPWPHVHIVPIIPTQPWFPKFDPTTINSDNNFTLDKIGKSPYSHVASELS